MANDSVARRYLEAFAALGVPALFGLPGVHNLAFWRDWSPELPGIVGVRHEQTAAYAADGLSRATGGLGVALTTTGPGAANAVAAFGEAAASGSPVLLVASEIATSLRRTGEVRGVLHESRDQAGLFEPLAKAVFRPRSAAEAVDALAEAVTAALRWPRGPVYLDVPVDVLSTPAPEVAVTLAGRTEPEMSDVDALATELAARSGAVLWAGAGVVQSGAEAELAELATRLRAPVVTTYGARGVMPPEHPYAVGLPPHEPEIARLVAEAGLLLAVGTDFDGMMTRNWGMPMPERLAAINCAHADLTRNYRPDLSVLGDARRTLAGLLERVPHDTERPDPALTPVHEKVWSRLAAAPDSAAAVEFLRSIESVTTDDTVVICDMAIPGYWYGGYGRVARPRRMQYPVGWGTLGYALPAAIGPAAAGQRVLVISGDGGAMFGLSELGTLAQEALPVTVLVVDDGGYGMLRYDQRVAGDPYRGVHPGGPDWQGLGTSFGVDTQVVRGAGAELQRALRAALDADTPRLVVTDVELAPPRTTSPRWFE